MKTKKRPTVTYTVEHLCDLTLGAFEFDGQRCFSMNYLTSSDPTENALLGEDGPYSCWDSDARFVEGGIEIYGADGPSGGVKRGVKLIIPKSKLRSISVEEM